MVRLTQSMREFLWTRYRDLIGLIMLGHLEFFTEEMTKEYVAWCQTDEGKQFLKGGSKYDAEYARSIGVE